VGARFVLDAMPGKQMAIDAELRAGSIDGGEARRRRRLLQRESQFHGAMDGAMKFVKGDVRFCVQPKGYERSHTC
jgi:type III secretion protein V